MSSTLSHLCFDSDDATALADLWSGSGTLQLVRRRSISATQVGPSGIPLFLGVKVDA